MLQMYPVYMMMKYGIIVWEDKFKVWIINKQKKKLIENYI